jgi:hypothetical protein
MANSFNDLFGTEEFGTYQGRKSDNKTYIGRNNVVGMLERSKALFLDPEYTYIKNRKSKNPLPCFAMDSEDRYSVRVIYARTTVAMPNGFDCIYCTKDRVPEVHDMLISAVKSGLFDEQLQQAQKQLTKPSINKE